MVALTREVNVQEEMTKPSNKVVVPDGLYPAVIVNSGIEQNPYSKDKPDGLFFHVVITSGPHANSEFHLHLAISDHNPFNADNPTWTPSKSAYGYIAQIAAALNYPDRLPQGFDTVNFHNKPLVIETKTKEGKDKDGNKKPEWNESFIKSFKPAASSGSPSPFNGGGNPPAFGGAPAAATAPSTPPWSTR